jgi:peptidyl-prolyl cis-trans isomerase D
MAAIGKIRQKSGLLIIIVGVALAAFVLGDLFKNMGRGKMNYDPLVIGYINGEKVATDKFRKEVEIGEENFMRNQNKKDLTPAERYSVQLQMWDMVKNRIVLRQQCEKVGLAQPNGYDPVPSLSVEEITDVLTGTHPHPYIVQNFKGQDGKFDPTMVNRFLQSIEAGKNSANAKDVEQALKSEKDWNNLEKLIKEDRLSTKYFNLISKGYFVPKTIASMKYHERNDSRDVRYTGVRYNLVNDSLVTPTDADYEAYYEEHKNEFKSKEETRKVDYIVWNVTPSEKDIKDIEKNVDEMYNELKDLPLEDVPGYINRNSSEPYDSSWRAQGSLSPFIDSLAFNSEPGTMFSPWREGNAYHFGRLMAVEMRPDSMKASHILIAYAGAARAAQEVTRTKIGAKALADSLFEVVKNDPSQFEDLATELSDGPSKTKQGDLGWFADGSMVPEFNQACLEGKVGEFKLVETVFGFHIIKITGKKDPSKKVRVALMNVPVMFSQTTYEEVFNEASQFVSRARDAASFDSVSVNMGLSVMHSGDLNKMSEGIMGIPDSRKIIQWLFDEKRTLGEVSDVFDFNDKVVVVLYNENTPKGIKPLDDNLKEFIKVLVMRDLKAKKLMEEYSGMNDINAIAQKAGSKVDTAEYFTFSAYSLRGYGPEKEVEGRIFAAGINKLYGPVKGDQGIFFFIVDKENVAQEPANGVDFIISQEKSTFEQGLRKDYYNSNKALKAIIDISDIQDYRQYFY